MAQGTVPISIDQLKVGVTCRHPIEDESGVLLLGAGTKINQQFISGLRDRGIDQIEVDPRDLAALRGISKPKAPASKRERTGESEWILAKPVKEMLVDRHDEGLSEERTEELNNNLESAKLYMSDLKGQILKQKIRSIDQLQGISDTYARSMVDDYDQTVGVMGSTSKLDELEERSVRMSVLGMAVAVELGLDGPQTLEVGTTAMLHDIGLYAMDERFRKPVEMMSEAERWEYRKHPLVSVLCVSDVMEVPPAVQLAMQQVHEQYDGSGYPRGVKGRRIHIYARILNVVDTYLQLTAPTAGRSPVVPHDALGLMLHQAGRGLFHPDVIKAFLNVETMFPLGSMVELDSGDVARVIRRPRSGFAAPVLENLDGNRIEMESARVAVVRPFCDPAVNQMRLSAELMQSSDWHPAHQPLPVGV